MLTSYKRHNLNLGHYLKMTEISMEFKGCWIGPKGGEGKQRGESGESKHGKMERRGDKGASHMQAGCWSVHLSDQSLHLMAAIYPILLNNFIKFLLSFFFPVFFFPVVYPTGNCCKSSVSANMEDARG